MTLRCGMGVMINREFLVRPLHEPGIVHILYLVALKIRYHSPSQICPRIKKNIEVATRKLALESLRRLCNDALSCPDIVSAKPRCKIDTKIFDDLAPVHYPIQQSQ